MKIVTKLDVESQSYTFDVWNEEECEYTTITEDTLVKDVGAEAKRLQVHPDLIETLRSNFMSIKDSLVTDLRDLWQRQNELEARIATLEKAGGRQ